MSVYRVGSNKSSVNNFPAVRPTLDLDFANSKTLDPRITFTRASGGSYVGADGLIKYAGVNEARFDHDPATGESLGLLIEEQRTNLLPRSEEFDSNPPWAPIRASITANAATAPNGTLTADKLIANTDNNTHSVEQTVTVTAGATYVFSVYAKAGELSDLRIIEDEEENTYSTIDLINGTATGGDVVNAGGGWFRCFVTMSTSGTTMNPMLRLGNSISQTFAGNNVDGLYLWGAQLEVGAFPTSYIPTQGSTRTRAEDSASITGKNFSEWYRQDEGTVYTSHIQKNSTDITQNWGIFSIRNVNATSTSFIRLFAGSGSSPVFDISISSLSSVYTIGNGSFFQNNIMKTVCSYSLSSAVRILNDNVPIEDTTVVLPSNLNNIIIGGGGFGLSSLNGTISKLAYYPKRLPNSQLQALTR